MANLDSFEFFSSEDRRSLAYTLCVGGSVVIGAAVTSLAGAPIPGAIAGGLWGLKSCRYLAEPIQKKLFSSAKLTEGEFRQAMISVRTQHPGISKKAALDLIAKARMEAAKGGQC